MENKVFHLLKQYFTNKKILSTLKDQRREFAEKNKCTSPIPMQGDCRWRDIPAEDFCDNCKVKHNYYLNIQKIAAKNRGVMTKLKNIVINHPQP
jgi:hypothetical protein